MNFCPNCGNPVNNGTNFCPSCGASLKQPPHENTEFQDTAHEQKKDDRWLIALLLSILVGSFGIHRFYTGNIFTGVLMLITFGGCGIWTIIDIVMIAVNTYKDGEGNLLK